jgi:hypothetical protein
MSRYDIPGANPRKHITGDLATRLILQYRKDIGPYAPIFYLGGTQVVLENIANFSPQNLLGGDPVC